MEQCLFIRLDLCGLIIAIVYALKTLILLGLNCFMIIGSIDYSRELAKVEYGPKADHMEIAKRLLAILFINLLVQCAIFLTTLLLIIGIAKYYRKYILPWLVFWLCYMITLIIEFLLLFMTKKAPIENMKGPGAIIGYIFLVCLDVLALVIVLRLYKAMRNDPLSDYF